MYKNRFVAAATERRRLLKQQKRLTDDDSIPSGGCMEAERDENVHREYPTENKWAYNQSRLACAQTSSSTFDDSTVSSKDFSFSFSMGNSGGSEPSEPSAVVTATPSRSILCHTKRSEFNPNTAITSKPTTTPRRSNIGPLHFEIGKSGTLTVDTNPSKRPEVANTPRNNAQSSTLKHVNITTPKQSIINTPRNNFQSSTPKHVNTTTPKHSIMNTPRKNAQSLTPKHVNITTPKQNILHEDSSSVISAVTNLEKMKILTEERDKCRADIAMFKRKLNTAVEKKNAAIQEKEHAVLDFEGRLSRQEKELELTKAQKQYSDYQLKLMEKKMNEHIDERVASLTKEMYRTKTKLNESSVELARVQRVNVNLNDEKHQVETREKALKCELKKAEEERNRMENWMRESTEHLQHVEKECQKKDMQHAQYEAQLEKSLKDLHRQKEIALSESMSQLSSVERKLSTALAEKEKVVSGLQHKITILQNELQTQRSNSESNKRQHSSIVEVLKSDIAMAQQMREESVSSMQKNFDESMAHFKSEVENLHSQLSDAKIRADDDRKVWEQNSKSQYERSLNSMRDANDSLLQQLTLAQEEVEDLHSQLRNVKTSLDKENGTLIEQLTLAKRDIDMIKAARDKDVLLLESELAKTRQEKKSIESEFEDVRQKLDIALSSMNAMALDGAKKQNDLESVLDNFTSETNRYQEDIDQMRKEMRKVIEEQQVQIVNLQREKEQHERDCTMLHKDISSLEKEVATRDQIINDITNGTNHYQDEIDQMRKFNEEQLGRLRNLQRDNEQNERDCIMLHKDVSSLKEEVLTRDQIINSLTNEKNRNQDDIDQMRKVNEEQLGRLRNLQSEQEQHEHDCTMLRKDISSLEEEVSTRDQIINNLTNETSRYQDEIDQMRKVNEEQLGRLRNLQREKEQYEHDCTMLHKDVSSLEEEVSTRDQIINNLTNENNRYQDEIDRTRKVNEEQLGRLRNLQGEKEHYEYECIMLRKNISSLEELEAAQSEVVECRTRTSVLEAEKDKLSTEVCRHLESLEQLRSVQREKSMELKRAQQTIQVLKSKERYLESRVDSLADQISKTVRDYEMRLQSSSSGEGSDC